MKLLKLTLNMFKGIKEFELDCDGSNCNVYGDNAVGKTTLKDALTWLLFDKNSEDKKDFGIMRMENGVEVHKTEPTVEAAFSMENGNILTLKKVYKEVWTKPRGQLEEVLSRHTTDYYIDGVPKSAGEYKKFIAGIIDEKRFKVLTEPRYFNEFLKPEERREILLGIVGGVDQAEIFRLNPDLHDLSIALQGKTVDDYKAMTAASLKSTKKQIDGIAPAIRENENMKPIQDVANLGLYEAQAERCKEQISVLEMNIARCKAGQADPTIMQKYNDRCKELATMRQNWHDKQGDARTALLQERMAAEAQQSDVESKMRNLQMALGRSEAEKQELIERRERLVEEFQEERSRTFQIAKDVQTICPVCKQDLPTEMVEKARKNVQKEVQQFNFERAERLKAINNKGKDVAMEIEARSIQIEQLNAQIDSLKYAHTAAKERMQTALETIKEFEEQTQIVPDEIVNLEKDIAQLKKQIDAPNEELEALILDKEKEKKVIQEQLSEALEHVAECKQVQKIKMRIRQLKEEEKELSDTYMQLQKMMFLCGEYTRKLTEYIDSKVGEHFNVARFRLFRNNITNEGVEECCDTMMDGKPYESLNAAAQVEVGLDIIRTLSEQYKFTAPVLMDNAESYTKLPDTGNLQIIRLVVSAPDKTLRVEKA